MHEYGHTAWLQDVVECVVLCLRRHTKQSLHAVPHGLHVDFAGSAYVERG